MSHPAVEDVKASLKPKLEQLITYLSGEHEAAAAAFFTGILTQLLAVREEEELLALFLELSTTAFMGFSFDDVSWHLTDTILQEAEYTAHAFSADQTMH